MTKPPIRYIMMGNLPPEVTEDPRFLDVEPGEVKVKVLLREGEVLVVAYSDDVEKSEALLRALGAEEIGVDLCG